MAALFPAQPTPKIPRKRGPSSDLIIAGAGVALGLTCALFPWYIFINQDEFGVTALKFDGDNSTSSRSGVQHDAVVASGEPVADDALAMQFDLFPTGTLPDRSRERPEPVSVAEQPFPASPADFKLLHVANGRALIEDEDGLWVMRPGSRLPDSSRVVSIEQREGRWVVVNSLDQTIEITR
ncbi:hypothetical protein [Aquamicrobium sp. LC103]|uniref:hypothetical protein n=1 Tax=Aquamicrobium sp. LC103 TaxID=1120658 RepID=UPI00069C532D|nr:hypothetical protein [Aquamicrobium sp. LC103]TKT77479.1 hypothetical protein XW59_013490 [Aquamicrobium sp. LC103]